MTQSPTKRLITEARGDARYTRPNIRQSKAIVVFSFDDDGVNDASVIRPLLESKGVRGVFCINTANVGVAGRPTWADLQAAAANGHEIIPHTVNHPDLTGASEATLTAEVDGSYQAFLDNGMPTPDGFCWPFGNSDANGRRHVRNLGLSYSFGPGATGGNPQPLQTYALTRYSIDSSSVNADVEAQINAAIAGGYLLIFLNHSSGTPNEPVVQHAIEYAQANTVPIMLMSQALAQVGNALDTGDLPGGTAATVVDGTGQIWFPGAGNVTADNLAGTALPSSYPNRKISYSLVNAANGSTWPSGSGNGGIVITYRFRGDVSADFYTYQEFIEFTNNRKWIRKATDSSTWGAWQATGSWNGTAGLDCTSLVSAFPIGTSTTAVNTSGGGPGGQAGCLVTNRPAPGTGTNYGYASQVFYVYNSTAAYRRAGNTDATWTAWANVSTPVNLVGAVVAETSVANTTTTTTLGTLTLPAGAVDHNGAIIKFKATGKTDNIATSGTLTLRLQQASNTLARIDFASVAGAATGKVWTFEGLITIRASGTSSTTYGMCQGATAMSGSAVSVLGTASTIALNTTVANALALTAQWGTANAGNVCYLEQFEVEFA